MGSGSGSGLGATLGVSCCVEGWNRWIRVRVTHHKVEPLLESNAKMRPTVRFRVRVTHVRMNIYRKAIVRHG